MSNERGSSSIDEVIALTQAGDRSGARRLALSLVQQNPEDTVALLWLAYTSDKVEEVEAVLNRVLAIEPNNQKALEWQNLLHQKEARGPLAPVPPAPPPSLRPTYQPPLPPSLSSGPTDSYYIQPQTNQRNTTNLSKSAPTSGQPLQPYQPPFAPAPAPYQNAQYRVMVEPGQASNTPRPYVMPYQPEAKSKKRWLPLAIVGGLLLLLLAFGAILLLTASPLKSKPGLADYRLFNTVEEVAAEGFVDERIAIERRFMGGYTKDAQGTYLLIYGEGKNTLYIQWNETATPINDFRPGQYVTVYGRIIGLSGNKITIKADKVTLTE